MKITQKQHLLAYLGYYRGAIDGIWGTGSMQATRELQAASGIKVDGIFGDGTLAAAKEAVTNDRFKEQAKPDVPQKPETGDFWAGVVGFTRKEFACPCPRCGGFPVEPSPKLVRVAMRIRDHFGGKPVKISSGVRCQAHNDELPGSVKDSRHIRGMAMDFTIRGVVPSQILAYCQQLRRDGTIRYTYRMKGTDYIHIDVDE